MTHSEAKKESQRRWGMGGWAQAAAGQCVVGCSLPASQHANPLGSGSTWEDAFAAADAREKETR